MWGLCWVIFPFPGEIEKKKAQTAGNGILCACSCVCIGPHHTADVIYTLYLGRSFSFLACSE